MADLLAQGLREEGHAVDVARDGTDALWLGTENDYDAIVLDVMIPGTPLAVLQTELELANRRPRSREELMVTVTAAQHETERLARLTEELLFLAAGDDDRREIPRLRERVTPVLDDALLALATRAAERQVTLGLDADPTLEASISTPLLRRAVENLLENALRYAPAGSQVSTRARSEDGQLVIEVLDEGPGFPVEFLPHAFERFRRADDARTRDAGGTGLGLAIVLAVARAHGGTAAAANDPTGGAVVGLRFPASS